MHWIAGPAASADLLECEKVILMCNKTAFILDAIHHEFRH
jgi:hypothetical protein